MSKEERPTYHSVPLRGSATYQMRHTTEEPATRRTTEAPRKSYISSTHMPAMPDDDELYERKRVSNSVRRYTDKKGNIVIEGPDRNYILHIRRRVGGLAIFGLGMIIAIILFTTAMIIIQKQQSAAQNAAFNAPIVTEQFAVVGHNGDSATRPSYFEFINLRGRVIIIELPAGDMSKALIYSGPQILGDNAYTQQVTAQFEDVNDDGRVDMIVTVGGQTITFLNNGTKFVPQQ